jgi:hypothetical protein
MLFRIVSSVSGTAVWLHEPSAPRERHCTYGLRLVLGGPTVRLKRGSRDLCVLLLAPHCFVHFAVKSREPRWALCFGIIHLRPPSKELLALNLALKILILLPN